MSRVVNDNCGLGHKKFGIIDTKKIACELTKNCVLMSMIIKLLLAACLLFRLTNCNTTNDDDSDRNISVCMA